MEKIRIFWEFWRCFGGLILDYELKMGISALNRRSNTQVLKKARKNVSIFFSFESVFVNNDPLLGGFCQKLKFPFLKPA